MMDKFVLSVLFIVEYAVVSIACIIPALILSYVASKAFSFVDFSRETFVFTLLALLSIRFVNNIKIMWKFSLPENKNKF